MSGLLISTGDETVILKDNMEQHRINNTKNNTKNSTNYNKEESHLSINSESSQLIKQSNNPTTLNLNSLSGVVNTTGTGQPATMIYSQQSLAFSGQLTLITKDNTVMDNSKLEGATAEMNNMLSEMYK